MKFRDLRSDEIEVRIGQVKRDHVVLLLYKNSRTDMNILDETVGPERWQREHYECKGNLFCRVGIVVETKKGDAVFPEWVWKADCGSESNMEAEKGESSDSFKRACTCWGIGRCLYTAPVIKVYSDKCDIKDGKCYDKFEVEKIAIENKRITGLAIKNVTKGVRAFVWTP